MLGFDWDEIDAAEVTGIVGEDVVTTPGGATQADAVAIVLGDRRIEITVNIDTDELRVALVEGGAPEGWTPITPLSDLVGRPLGWCWEGKNYRGYEDVFLLSFSGWPVTDPRHDRSSPLDPDVMFIGCASMVQLARLRAV